MKLSGSPLFIALGLTALAGMGCSRKSPAAAASTRETSAPSSAVAAAAPVRTASFKFATQTLTVPEGFTVELVAAPPLVNRPISIAFDEQGRLYATDSSGLSERAPKQFEEKPHRVVRLEDRDGDGRFEHSTVFAERMMFPQGALFYEGSLYVAAPPHIWKLTDTNGDGVADQREAWYDGKTLTGCANDLHGPYLGPEGWFYWTKGAFAEQRHTLGNGKAFVTRAAHIFRSRPDGTGLEPVLTGGMDNPVGVAFSSTGERFLSGTFFQLPAAGKRDGLIHAIYGGVYGKENAASAGHPRTGDLMPMMTHMGAAAPCGSTTYRSNGFGADYAENLFVCYFNLRKVSRHQLTPAGATFTTRDTDFVTSDSADFRPTDVLEDADGSLLVVDTGGWYKICCPTSQLAKPDVLGGIYRIRKTGAPKPADPRGLAIAWTTAPTADLASVLADDRLYVREQAQHRLGQKGVAAVPALASVLGTSPSPLARRNAVWTLARIADPAARAAVRTALRDRDASVVHTALQAVSLTRDGEALPALTELVAGPDAAPARLAAEALGRIGDPRAIAALLAATRRWPEAKDLSQGSPADPADRTLEHAVIHALIEIGRPDDLRAVLTATEQPRTIRAALVALDQMEGGGLQPADVIGSLDAATPVVRQTAAWIVSHHPEWGGTLAGFFRRQLASLPRPDAVRDGLRKQLAELASSPAIQELIASVVSEAEFSHDARLLALRTMAASSLKETPAAWWTALAGVLGKSDVTLNRAAVAAARVLPAAKGGHAALSAALVQTGRDARVPADVRLDALAAATPSALAPVEPALFDFLCAHLDSREPMLVRTTAAGVLAKAPLTPAQQLALTDSVQRAGALETPKLLPAFERAPNEALGLKLVAALQHSPGLTGVRASALQPLLAKYPATVQNAGAALLTRLNADGAMQNARVDSLLASIATGDVRRGQAVFNSGKTACSLCHVIGYGGGRFGPDLTSIGRIRNERELLEAIVYPSATFVRGYDPLVVTLKNGVTHSGIMKKDAADEVVLTTGPDTETRLARSDIADLQPGPVSPMPPGMDAVLTPQELMDLVVFLKSRQ
ncbi:PVC-type heme-binding CxxCH protein [Horticoccus sp. 23ND18S-11]|uniref:PVC-type heme-binding CxxCH protein n=1 Tax=Horticoccus sp. 23ND18S-11 TaxID=3391832 RepID=UPI0039C9EEB0